MYQTWFIGNKMVVVSRADLIKWCLSKEHEYLECAHAASCSCSLYYHAGVTTLDAGLRACYVPLHGSEAERACAAPAADWPTSVKVLLGRYGVVNVTGEGHLKLRKTLNPSFRLGPVNEVVPRMAALAERCCARWASRDSQAFHCLACVVHRLPRSLLEVGLAPLQVGQPGEGQGAAGRQGVHLPGGLLLTKNFPANFQINTALVTACQSLTTTATILHCAHPISAHLSWAERADRRMGEVPRPPGVTSVWVMCTGIVHRWRWSSSWALTPRC